LKISHVLELRKLVNIKKQQSDIFTEKVALYDIFGRVLTINNQIMNNNSIDAYADNCLTTIKQDRNNADKLSAIYYTISKNTTVWDTALTQKLEVIENSGDEEVLNEYIEKKLGTDNNFLNILEQHIKTREAILRHLPTIIDLPNYDIGYRENLDTVAQQLSLYNNFFAHATEIYSTEENSMP